jgi:peptidoglycan/LPS O-acetylase OafA/YrhL
LLPALGLMLAVTLLLSAFLAAIAAQPIAARTGASASLFNANTYLHHVGGGGGGYFGLNAEANPFLHTWSLAVEEQFYIFWPFILMSLRLCSIPRWLYFFVLSGAITWVCIHRIGLWDSGKSYIFLYSQTDTRIDSILVGCLFAFIYRYINFSATKVKSMGFIACVILLPFSYLFADYSEPLLYKGGFTFIAILIGICILACTTSESIATKILRHKALTNLGRMSYGLYLWHMLIFRLSERHLNIGSNSFRILATTCFTLLIAQFSWRYIEQPFINLKNRRFQEFL